MDAMVSELQEAIAVADQMLDCAEKGRSCFRQLCGDVNALKTLLMLIASQMKDSRTEGPTVQALTNAVKDTKETLGAAMKLIEQANDQTYRNLLVYNIPFINPTPSVASALQKANRDLLNAHSRAVTNRQRDNTVFSPEQHSPGLQAGGNQVIGTAYHPRMMEFLECQLSEARKVSWPEDTLENWTSEWQYALEQGDRLLEKHKEFDLKKFYKTSDAKQGIEKVCRKLKALLLEIHPGSTEKIVDEVPEDFVKEDRVLLYLRLSLVFGLQQGNHQHAIGGEAMQNWEAVKREHEERLQLLRVMDKSEIQLETLINEGAYGELYRARVGEEIRAVKKLKTDKDGPINFILEDFASFFKEVSIQASLDAQYVARVFGTTRNGWIVMEMADNDLRRLTHGNGGMPWPAKFSLVHKAAKALKHVHSKRVVHCDVKARNFLVFGEDPTSCDVKITDFGISVEETATRSKTVRCPGGTFLWTAPEVCTGEPPTTMSDVYSFGVTMYEVVTGVSPFRRAPAEGRNTLNTLHLTVLHNKLGERDPCVVLDHHCPREMKRIMRECIQKDQERRPSMEDVVRRLEALRDSKAAVTVKNTDDPKIVTRNVPSEVNTASKAIRIVNAARDVMEAVEYNKGTLRFLIMQLQQLANELTAENILAAQQRGWGGSDLLRSLKAAQRLVNRHAQPFNLQEFYSSREAVHVVERICDELRQFVFSAHLHHKVTINDTVPAECAESDANFLCMGLGFVMGGEELSTHDVSVKVYWKVALGELQQKMQGLTVILEDEVVVGEQIGQGASGNVHWAQWGGKRVAIKKLGLGYESVIWEDRLRFVCEAAIHARVHHPAICTIYGVTKTHRWLVMEPADMDLRMCLNRRDTIFSLKVRLHLMQKASEGLAHLHSMHVVHRDVKPSNFLIFGAEDPETASVKLTDFGVAVGQSEDWRVAQTMRGQPGTQEYMAVELYDGRNATARSDVYSFAIVMCEILTGRRPYASANNFYGIVAAKFREELPCPLPKDCPDVLLELIRHCLAMNPKKRPRMTVVADTLNSVAAELGFL
ncbi:unnamed protein product [Ostreobium quekettii]|uniref:Protein kinase domain-containing protein n=1 Tax=Ostreobium quekettii TaxID=121088 RepID=A0A8S1IX26_9CHLO|nr:unnamed protein product [Ostreobium quekettii]